MKPHIFPVAAILLVLLVAALSFATLRVPSPVQAASESTSQQQLRNVVEARAPESCPVTKPPAHAFVPPSPLSNRVGSRVVFSRHRETLDFSVPGRNGWP